MTLEMRAQDYAIEESVMYTDRLDYYEQQDPYEWQAAAEVYEQAYWEYYLQHEDEWIIDC